MTYDQEGNEVPHQETWGDLGEDQAEHEEPHQVVRGDLGDDGPDDSDDDSDNGGNGPGGAGNPSKALGDGRWLHALKTEGKAYFTAS